MTRELILTLTLMLSICVQSKSQQDERNKFNPLPPGPTRISGEVVDRYGNPIKDARITVKYPDKKQRDADIFFTNEWGRYSASVFRYDQPFIVLEIKVDNKVCKTIRYNDPGRGMNLGFSEKATVCKVRKKRSRRKENKRESTPG